MVFIFIGMFFAFMANFYWYKIKTILKKKSFKVDYFFSHSNDLGNFQHLINNTDDIEIKTSYKKILLRLRGSILLTVISGVSYIIYIMSVLGAWDDLFGIFNNR